MHVVIIGAVALGPKAAARFKRLMPEAHVILIDQASRISYGGCGIPYYLSGEVDRLSALRETTYGAVRDAEFFKTSKDIDVLTRVKAVGLDRKNKIVRLRHLDHPGAQPGQANPANLANSGNPAQPGDGASGADGEISELHYDKLVLALGSEPNLPPIPGLELAGVTPCTNLDEAELIKNAISKGEVSGAVIVGGGFIGLEVAVAFADMWGIPTSVVEYAPHILPNTLSPDLAAMAAKDLADNGVSVHCNEKVLRLEGVNGRVSKVITDKRTIEANLVILSAGVKPATQIAREAGLRLGERGAIIVDEYLRTSDPDIYSGGDCAQVRNLITGKAEGPNNWFPLGSLANRQGRVIGSNLAGGNATFPGAVGTWAVKLFKLSAAGAGFTLAAARKAGYNALSVHVEQLDKAHFYPEKNIISLELVVDQPSGKVLGIQGCSANGEGLLARINPVSALLGRGAQVSDISNLEVAYSPPFAAAMDVVNTVGNLAENALAGRYKSMSPGEFKTLWEARVQDNPYVLDARVASQGGRLEKNYPENWHSIPADQLRERLDEVPQDRPLVLICSTGLRSYDAQLTLTHAGFTNHKSVAGGLTAQRLLGTKIEE